MLAEPGGEGAVLLLGVFPRSRSLALTPSVDALRLANSGWQAAWAVAGLKGMEVYGPCLAGGPSARQPVGARLWLAHFGPGAPEVRLRK